MDSLRYWILEMHVDGFRFDLAAALARELHDVDRLSAFFDLVQQELIDKYGINTVRNGGLKAYTTIDPDLQAKAEAAVATCSESGFCYPEGGPAAGLASVNPDSGEIVALASTKGYASEEQFNYAWQAHRQPGSSFKTYVLTTAIKQGIDPATTYYNGTSPMTLALPGGGSWTVNNDEPGGGVMSLESATWNSINVVFAQLDLDVGSENVTHTAHQMGIEAPLESVPAEAIGGLAVGVTPLEMADGYATLANGGVHHDPTAIKRVEFPDGKVDEADNEAGDRVLTPGQAYDVTQILKGVITQGTGAGYTSIGCAGEAGKTGTSEDESDAWFVGYTPMYSTAVWVGHPQSRESTGFGGPTAGPIWRNFMEAAQEGECPEFEVPSSLPELSGLSGDHTSSSSYSSSGEGEEESFESTKKPKKEEGESESESETEGEPAEPTPAPTPTPTPAPTPTPSGPPPAVGGGIGLDAADEVTNHLRPVQEMRPQHVRRDQGIGEIDRRARRQRSDQEFDQPDRAQIAPEQIPVPVDRDGGEGLLLRQHVVERTADFAHFRRGEVSLPPHRGKACRRQQRIVLAQRHVERRCEPHHHVAAGRGAA